ncbi:hypothetical protein QYF36_014775 [Acer negundo]|nr:hypothetical protein QYF36_014775 [Acer negundo]
MGRLWMIFGVQEVDDLTLRRFLRARDLDIEKGSTMFLKYLKWRRSFVPNGSISPSEVPNEIAQNKMFLQGFDKKGRPIGVAFGARHFQNKQNPEEFKRFAVYLLDKLCEKMGAGQEKFVVIVDLQGWGYSNSDIRACLGALSILQAILNCCTYIRSQLLISVSSLYSLVRFPPILISSWCPPFAAAGTALV